MKWKNKWLPAVCFIVLTTSVSSAQTPQMDPKEFKAKTKWLERALKDGENSIRSLNKGTYRMTLTGLKFDGCRASVRRTSSMVIPHRLNPPDFRPPDFLSDEAYQVNAARGSRRTVTVFNLKYMDDREVRTEPGKERNIFRLLLRTINEDREVFVYSSGDRDKVPTIGSRVGFSVKAEKAEKAARIFGELIRQCRK